MPAKVSFIFTAASLFSTALCSAEVLTIDLPPLNRPFSLDSSLTFSGNGWLSASDFAYYRGFTIDNVHSYFQADISAIEGEHVRNATLSFHIAGFLDTNAVFTSFESNGTLGWHYLPPNAVSATVVTVNGGEGDAFHGPYMLNEVNVTDMVQERVNAGSAYFALHMNGSTGNLWNYPGDYTAQLSLRIVYGDPVRTTAGISVTAPHTARLFWNSSTNQAYQIQQCDSLMDGAWVDVGTTINGTGDEVYVVQDPTEPTGFYQVIVIE